jgi:hypothetical protein
MLQTIDLRGSYSWIAEEEASEREGKHEVALGMAISDWLAGLPPSLRASLCRELSTSDFCERLWTFQLTVCLSTSTSLCQRYSRVGTTLCRVSMIGYLSALDTSLKSPAFQRF